MNLRAVRLLFAGCVVCLAVPAVNAGPSAGKISGVVVDGNGTPQMGARVLISSENLLSSSAVKVRTNERGAFSSVTLPAGIYSVEVTLAGFLPTLQSHIEVSGTHTTTVQLVLGSVFASLGQLRKEPEQKQGASDDWVWVLRSAPATRPVLRWNEDGAALSAYDSEAAREQEHGLVQVSSGVARPTSISNSPVAPATAFAYDVPMGQQGRVLLAGQMSYLNQATSTGLATEWLPAGSAAVGPVTTLVVRQSQFGPGQPVFRGARFSHDDVLQVGERVSVRYGGEFVFAGFGTATSAVRPRAEVAMEMSPDWQFSLIMATHPWNNTVGDTPDALRSAVNSFDAFPTLMMRQGKPVFENGLHEEAAIKHCLGDGAELSAAVFHDKSTHTAVLGQGVVTHADFVQGFFGNAFAYDGGETSSTGARAVYQQHLSNNFTSTVIYDYSGALVPEANREGRHLRDQLHTKYRQSVATRVSAKIPVVNTKVVVGYKWLNGPTVSQQDAYGEAIYGVDPYLSMGLRQPLPSVFPGHMVVQADMGNVLGQGGVAMTTATSKSVLIVPAYRYFRGGLSFQF